jgi:polyferredoxin
MHRLCRLHRRLRPGHGQDELPARLIRYSTENAMKRNWGSKEILAHVFRPRIMIYAVVLVAICSAFVWGLATRSNLRVDVIKDRSTLSREVEGGLIANVYNLQVMNMTEKPRRFALSASGLDGVKITPAEPFEVDAAGLKAVTVEVAVPPESGKPGSNTVYIEVKALDDETVSVREKTAFLIPR